QLVGGQVLQSSACGAGRQAQTNGNIGRLDVVTFLDDLISTASDRRNAVHGHGLDDVERLLALDAEQVEPGGEPFKHEAQARVAFAAEDGLDLPRMPVALDRS